MKKVAMIGVGKLGQDCAEVMADAGYEVVGYDVEPRSPAFQMCSTIEEAVKDRDFIFIAAPTPHDPIYGGETPTSHLPNKDFDYTIVTNILTEVNKYVNKKQLVVLISTVLPGTVRNHLEPCITNARFIYNPYLIAMGTIKWDMVNPEMIIIGTEDGSITGDAKELIDFYSIFMVNNPRYEVGTWDEAESIKIFYNTFISTKLALVNMVQDVAETNGNINVDVVTKALANSTQRIMGPAYMTAGLGDAGACHPRDNIALRYLADRLDLGYDLFDSIMTAREVQAQRMALRCVKNGKNVTIIGKAYKPAVPYTNGSASMLVGHYIEKYGGTVNYYDENTGELDLRKGWTEVLLIGYWDTWTINALNRSISGNKDTPVIIDPWRKLDQPKMKDKLHGQTEIISYGDTRVKNNYGIQFLYKTSEAIEWWYNDSYSRVFTLWPELEKYKDVIHLIDAEVGPTNFILRPTELIVKELLAAQRKGKTKFLFLGLAEGYYFNTISKIHRIANLVENQINSKDIVYVCSSIGVADTYNAIHNVDLSTSIWRNRISVWSACSAQMFYQRGYAYNHELKGNIPYEIKEKDKKFLSFNRVHREHRLKLVDRLIENNMLDSGYCSFDPPDAETSFANWITHLPDRFNNIKSNKSMFPLKLNITSDRPNPADLLPDDMKYFNNSYFSIVTESGFYNVEDDSKLVLNYSSIHTNIFFTEKIFKPLLCMHPFVLLCFPGALARLRQMGYRTFSPFIDETYDTIENPDERFEALWKEITRLLQKTPEEWTQWQTNIKEIVEHNHSHFFVNKNFLSTNVESQFT